MKLHIFGSCSGTEPYPGRHHCSFALECGGGLYWFDAGENCSHTAYTMGLDVMKIRKVFISHPHIDHVGGLPDLFFVLDKIAGRYNRTLEVGTLEVVTPDIAKFDAAMTLAFGNTRSSRVPITARKTVEGLLCDDGNAIVTACKNEHIRFEEGSDPKSFTFGITLREDGEEKRVVYSGDVKSVAECEAFLRERPTDIFIMESGHHNPPEVAKWLVENDVAVGRLVFIHHGRHLLDTYSATVADIHSEYDPRPFIIAEDAMTLSI